MDGHDGALAHAYRGQTVEIALGPKGSFENRNVGALTRRVATPRIVSAAPARRGELERPRDPRTPQVVELLRRALAWQALLECGEAVNQAEIARREGITRARVTQVMALLRLAPEIQQRILSLPDTVRRPAITEHALRPIVQLYDPANQKARFAALAGQTE